MIYFECFKFKMFNKIVLKVFILRISFHFLSEKSKITFLNNVFYNFPFTFTNFKPMLLLCFHFVRKFIFVHTTSSHEGLTTPATDSLSLRFALTYPPPLPIIIKIQFVRQLACYYK